jgi:DNA-binding NtrC family response regulator
VKRHEWLNNVRQLYNALVPAAVLTDGDTMERGDLVASLGEMLDQTDSPTALLDRPLGGGSNLDEYLNDIHRNYLRRVMEESRGLRPKPRGFSA